VKPAVVNTLSKFNNYHINLWYTFIDSHEKDVIKLSEYLNQEELRKANRIKSVKERNNCVITLAVLKILLGYYLDKNPCEIILSYTKYNKPYLKYSDLKFNLSHSGNILLIGFALNFEIGVDVEKMEEFPEADDVAKNFFSSYEYKSFSSLQNNERIEGFYNCWTRKEAFIKAVGSGLSYSLKEFDVTLAPGADSKIVKIKNDKSEGENWSLFSLDLISNYKAAVAVRLKECRMKISKYPAQAVPQLNKIF
jgi:4'-phosphopantetheinyl transferase